MNTIVHTFFCTWIPHLPSFYLPSPWLSLLIRLVSINPSWWKVIENLGNFEQSSAFLPPPRAKWYELLQDTNALEICGWRLYGWGGIEKAAEWFQLFTPCGKLTEAERRLTWYCLRGNTVAVTASRKSVKMPRLIAAIVFTQDRSSSTNDGGGQLPLDIWQSNRSSITYQLTIYQVCW